MAVTMPAAGQADDSGDLLVWILVWSELAVFGALLAAFLGMSIVEAGPFAAGKLLLSARLAGFNTVVLLASGWQAALAASARARLAQQVHLGAAAVLGFVFAALKVVEYAAEWAPAGDPAFQTFFELYFLLTGFHLAHVVFLAGLMLFIAFRPVRSHIAVVTTLWHLVDIVWLVMFPIVYLG